MPSLALAIGLNVKLSQNKKHKRGPNPSPLLQLRYVAWCPILLPFGCLKLLFQLQLRRPRATLHDLEIALDPIGPDFVWVRTFTASSEHSVLVEL